MVKLIIMSDGKVIEKEGMFASGFVATDEGTATRLDSFIVGSQKRASSLGRIMAEHAFSVLKKAFKDSMDCTAQILEFEDAVAKKVHEYVANNHEAIAADISAALKELVGASNEQA